MEKLLFYTGTVLLIIAIILILFAIVAVFKNKNYFKYFAMAITIILLSMLALGIHKMIESNNPSENQATQSKDKQSKEDKSSKDKKKKDKKMTTKMIIMLLKKNKIVLKKLQLMKN